MKDDTSNNIPKQELSFENLERAFAKMSNQKDLELECEFYRFAHSSEIGEQTKALAEIKKLISGARERTTDLPRGPLRDGCG